jgi:hypothetical protein
MTPVIMMMEKLVESWLYITDYIKMDLKEIGWENMHFIPLTPE